MKLHNLRFKFANNSSSSHSLILVDEESLKNLRSDSSDGEYGWNDFLLVSKNEKARYLGVMLYNQIKDMIPDDVCKILFEKSLNIDLPRDGDYIDHQSNYVIPRDMRTGFVHWGFFNEFAQYILKSNIVIQGGNDNDDERSYIEGNRIDLPIPQDRTNSNFVVRKDPLYEYWSLFDKGTGNKIRFSIDKELDPNKSYSPELVDLKITNNCDMGCTYCYQNSNKNGLHANGYEVERIIDYLSELEVFEIAFGGGEVFNHPNFINFLKYAKSKGITPNFSTRNIKWLEDDLTRSEVLNNCGSFAYSVDKSKQVERLGTIFEYFSIPSKKASIQLAMGSISDWEFERILRSCYKNGFSLTLLGFKNVGRGKDFKKTNYQWMMKEIKKARKSGNNEYYCPSISMDTALVSEFAKEIIESEIPDYMYHVLEGKFSCYIDAVDKKIGPSSFCDEKEMANFPVSEYNKSHRVFDKDWFVEEYSKF